MALFAMKYRGPGIIGLGPDKHFRKARSASCAPSVPRSLQYPVYQSTDVPYDACVRYKRETYRTDVNPAKSVRRAWAVARTVRSARLSLVTWSSHVVSEY